MTSPADPQKDLQRKIVLALGTALFLLGLLAFYFAS